MPSPKTKSDWWPFLALLFLLTQAALFVICQLRLGSPGLVAWYFGSDPLIWGMVVVPVLAYATVKSALRRPFFNRIRIMGYGTLIVLALSPRAFQVYPSSHENHPSQVAFRVPFDVPVKVAWGGDSPDNNYHVIAPDQRWAYDLVMVKDGVTHRGDGSSIADYYCFGQPILAPATGTVVSTYTNAVDMPVGQLGGTPAGGNQIVIEVATNQFLYLCHFKERSIKVAPGDTVTTGQELGLVGNSGNTSEPHLHLHLQDTPYDHFGEGIPLLFHQYLEDETPVAQGMPVGGFQDGQLTGNIIQHNPTVTQPQP